MGRWNTWWTELHKEFWLIMQTCEDARTTIEQMNDLVGLTRRRLIDSIHLLTPVF